MFQQLNPATERTGERFDALTDDMIETRLAEAEAEAGYRDWRTSTLQERATLLTAIADRFDAARDDLAATVTFEMGKPLAAARAEVDKCVAGFRFYAEHGPAMLDAREIGYGDGKRATVLRRPLGPVLAIMPWNFPLWQAVRFIAPAIMAGNVGLLKHASNVPGSAQAIEDLIRDAGAPAGVFANLHIGANAVGALIDDRRIAAVTLTGSEGAGIKVAERAGRNLKKVVLELGGSDPFVVMPSADLAEAARVGAKARTQNSGQSCICAKRMIVHRHVYDEFRDAFVAAMAAVRVGDPTSDGTEMGPLSSAQARDDIEDQVARAGAAGGRVIGGGRIEGPGFFYRPAVIEVLPRDSAIASEELFGPVATLWRATDIDDAIALANATPFGLGASVWTNDDAEQLRLTEEIEAGMIAINQMLASDPHAPFGGIKRSGHGRELAADGLYEFMNVKAIMR